MLDNIYEINAVAILRNEAIEREINSRKNKSSIIKRLIRNFSR